MRLTKKVAAVAAALLLPAAVAVAAAPSGDFSGTVHGKPVNGRQDPYQITATFKKGNLTRLQGTGPWIPYDPSKSNSEVCGAANTFDTGNSDAPFTITGQTAKDGTFSYTAKDKFHTVITLKGQFVSDTKAKSHFRFYQSHLPRYANGKVSSTGHCDSGQMRLKLTAGG